MASFKEALFKEMEYCKDINIEQYIFNEFVEFIKNNIYTNLKSKGKQEKQETCNC